jgi:hypothetical protein
MRNNPIRLAALLCLALLVLVIPASAHEGRTVGDYSIVFGWRAEPAYTGLLNGPEFTITVAGDHHEEASATEEPEAEGLEATDEADDHEEAHDEELSEAVATEEAGTHTDMGMDDHHEEAAAVVEGAEETLQLELTFGDQTKVLRLRAVYGEPGAYTADLIPTLPGDYSFHLTGTINGTEVDEVFSSADGEFSTVEPIEDIQFP